MSDTGTGSDCTICVTNNGDIANVDKDFDLTDISVSSEGTVNLTDFDSLSESDNNNPVVYPSYSCDVTDFGRTHFGHYTNPTT